MRLALVFTLVPVAANAHAGHIAGLGGHDHWVLGAALGAAAAAAIWAWLKDRDPDDDEEEISDEESIEEGEPA